MAEGVAIRDVLRWEVTPVPSAGSDAGPAVSADAGTAGSSTASVTSEPIPWGQFVIVEAAADAPCQLLVDHFAAEALRGGSGVVLITQQSTRRRHEAVYKRLGVTPEQNRDRFALIKLQLSTGPEDSKHDLAGDAGTVRRPPTTATGKLSSYMSSRTAAVSDVTATTLQQVRTVVQGCAAAAGSKKLLVLLEDMEQLQLLPTATVGDFTAWLRQLRAAVDSAHDLACVLVMRPTAATAAKDAVVRYFVAVRCLGVVTRLLDQIACLKELGTSTVKMSGPGSEAGSVRAVLEVSGVTTIPSFKLTESATGVINALTA